MKLECRTRFDGAKITDAAKRAGLTGLYRSAGLLMKIARQKIKYRRRTISKPGASPFQHSKGRQSFRHSIRFAIDRQNLAAYIGPQKIAGKVGKNVPHTLEFGGMTGPAPNPTWYKTDGVPRGMNSESAIAAWLMREGYGPLFMAGSESGVVNQYFSSRGKKYSRQRIAESKKAKPDQWIFRNIQRRKNPGTKKTVFYITVPIRSTKQAIQAAKNIVKFYGMPNIKPHYVSPRPFMGPSLQDSRNHLAEFFANTI